MHSRYWIAAAAAALSLTGAAQAQDLPEGAGKSVVTENCTTCHDVSVLTAKRRSPGEWTEVVDRMVGMGATLNAAQTRQILAYLNAHLGTGAQAASGGQPARASAAPRATTVAAAPAAPSRAQPARPAQPAAAAQPARAPASPTAPSRTSASARNTVNDYTPAEEQRARAAATRQGYRVGAVTMAQDGNLFLNATKDGKTVALTVTREGLVLPGLWNPPAPAGSAPSPARP